MFEKVLVSMDLSPATEALVSTLPSLREFGTRELTLVHVAKPHRGPTSEFLADVREVRDRLAALAEKLKDMGFLVTVSVPTGAPAVEEHQGCRGMLFIRRTFRRRREELDPGSEVSHGKV